MGGWEIILPSSHPHTRHSHHPTLIIPSRPSRSHPFLPFHPRPIHRSPSRPSPSQPSIPIFPVPSSRPRHPAPIVPLSFPLHPLLPLPSPIPTTPDHTTMSTGHPPPLKMTPVGFEPTPFRNGALSHRLRPLGQSVVTLLQVASLGPFFAQILDPAGGMGCSAPPAQAAPAGATHKHGTELLQGWVVGGRVAQDSRPGAGSGPHG